jgi:hypothetical protein
VTEEEHEDLGGQEEFGGQYHEFEPVPKDPNREQEFAEDANEAKSNYSHIGHVDPIFKHNP